MQTVLRSFFILLQFFLIISDNSADAATPIARFDVVPNQRISTGEQFNIGVIAFSIAGIDRVEFAIAGQGYQGSNPLVVKNMSYNPRTGVYEYWVPLKAEDFVSDGVVTIEATVFGNDGGRKDKNWLIDGFLGTDYTISNFYTNDNGHYQYYTAITATEAFDESMLYSDVIIYKKDSDWWEGIRMNLNEIDGNVITVEYGESYGSSPQVLDYRPAEGDGFIMSRGFGLDPVVLVVNPNGTLPDPVAYVDLEGNDETGEVNNAGKPFASTGKAMFAIRDWMVTNGHGATINGGRLILNPGTHTLSNGGKYGDIRTTDEWFTFTANHDLGGNKINTKITGFQLTATELIKVSDLTVFSFDDTKDVFAVGSTFRPKFKLWVDNCNLQGASRYNSVANPVSSKFLWYTDSYLTNMGKAVSEAQLARNLTIEHIGDDAFVRSPFVINSRAYDIDPRDGTCEGGDCAHADCWQWWGRPVPNNMIIYGYDCLDCTYQGLFARTQDGNVPQGFQNPVTEGVAIVNLHTKLIDPANFAENSWSISVNHMLLWHSTFNLDFNFWNDSDAVVSKYPLNITDFDVRANCFYDVELKALSDQNNGGDPDAQGIELLNWSDNHYEMEAGSNYWVETPGVNSTVGDPKLDSNGVPSAGSPLINRLSSPLVLTDAHNNLRDPRFDVGAFEYLAPASVLSTEMFLFLPAILSGSKRLNKAKSGK